MGKEGKEVEFSAEEENASSVVEKVAEASGISLNLLDHGLAEPRFVHGFVQVFENVETIMHHGRQRT